jgi:hypothetical protein
LPVYHLCDEVITATATDFVADEVVDEVTIAKTTVANNITSSYAIHPGEHIAYDAVTGTDAQSHPPPPSSADSRLVEPSSITTSHPPPQVHAEGMPLSPIISQAVSMIRAQTTSNRSAEQSPVKKMKLQLTMEDGVASIYARDKEMASMPAPCQMGSNHPCFESNSLRVPASDAEKSWLFHYYLKSSPVQGGNPYQSCLNAICINNIARALFHERHVRNSDRLKTIALPVIKSVKEYEEFQIVPEWLLLHEYDA